MKFCPECGENVENITDRCPNCGFDIAACLKEIETKERERMEKDSFLFTEKHYDFANPDFHCSSQCLPDMVTATPMIRLNPVFKEMVWGGNRLKTEFGYDIPGDDTGECWAISAHPHGDCTVNGGQYDGKKLSWLWENVPQLFGRQPLQESTEDCTPAKTEKPAVSEASGDPVTGKQLSSDCFPLLIKIIDAKKDLSIQVHPDDEYARIHENGSKGKTECWYILDCDPGATIIVGHNAKTHEELEDMIANNRWNDLLREIPIKKGDFFQIFPGTVHAIKGGTLILETQQNSDVTYRVYDYGRLQNGKPRDLHIRQSLDVIRVPFDASAGFEKGTPLAGSANESLVECGKYRVWHLTCTEGSVYRGPGTGYMLCSVISGEGGILPVSDTGNALPVDAGAGLDTDLGINWTMMADKTFTGLKKGDHFILTSGFTSFMTKGSFEMICSMPNICIWAGIVLK